MERVGLVLGWRGLLVERGMGAARCEVAGLLVECGTNGARCRVAGAAG